MPPLPSICSAREEARVELWTLGPRLNFAGGSVTIFLFRVIFVVLFGHALTLKTEGDEIYWNDLFGVRLQARSRW
jgi:hypothetical protein